MTRHCSNEYAQNLEFHQALTSASKSGDNHDLGSVFIYVTNAGPMAISISYPVNNTFSDGCGKAIKGNLISFIRSDNANWLTGNSTSSWQTSQKV